MQLLTRGQMSSPHGRWPLANPLLVLLMVSAAHAESLGMESLKDSIGGELLTRVDVQRDTLGDLGDASTDVDAPEQLNLPSAPKVQEATPVEIALIQGKASHKQEPVEAPRHLRAKRQVAQKLLPVEEEPLKQEATPEDADVEKLGGQLQNIMSELGDPAAPAIENKPSSVVQASVAETPANEEDLAMEKEVGDVSKSGDPKDDAENVVDGAMAYIRTRLATEEHKSLRLRQLLQQGLRSNRNMRQELTTLQSQLVEGAKLQKSLRTVSAQKVSQEDAKFLMEKAHSGTLASQLANATKAAQIGEKAMKFLGMRLKYTKSQVAALLLNLANSSQQNNDLRRRLGALNSTEAKESKLAGTTKKVVDAQAQELAETKAELKKVKAVKAAEDKKLVALDQKNNLLEHRQVSTEKRDKILHKENLMLKSQLATEIQREEQLREMWSKESEAFTWQLRAERTNATDSLADLEKARTEFKDLRERVQKLRQKASVGEQQRHQAEDSANKAQFALAEAEAENKQLKGSVPWLEAEVDRQRQTVQNTTKQAKQALRERDTVKAILAEAQKNIVQLQGQYADALQALVVAQAGVAVDTKPQEPASSIQQFASLGAFPLGLPPADPVPVFGASAASSLLELGRDSKALNNIMGDSQVNKPHARVDLSKDSGGLNALLQGMNADK